MKGERVSQMTRNRKRAHLITDHRSRFSNLSTPFLSASGKQLQGWVPDIDRADLGPQLVGLNNDRGHDLFGLREQ